MSHAGSTYEGERIETALRKNSNIYLVLGFVLLLFSLIFSIYLINNMYIIERKTYTIHYSLNSNEALLYNFSSFSKSIYVSYLNYTVLNIKGDAESLDLYIVIFNNHNVPIKSKKILFDRKIQTINIESLISKAQLIVVANKSVKGNFEIDLVYVIKPGYYNFLSFINMLVGSLGIFLAITGLYYYLLYRYIDLESTDYNFSIKAEKLK